MNALIGMKRSLRRAGRSIWRVLEEHGRIRASRDLLNAADRWELHQPALAQELRMAARRRGR